MVLTQNDQKFYLATIPAFDLFPYCFVSSRDKDPKKGFQRILSEDRALDIAKYLDNSTGSIPTNIVLSAQDSAELSYSANSKTIKYLRNTKSFLVIDGQHRLYGYGLAKKAHRIPVAIYESLTRKDEASLFIDINTNQKGVPAALLLDIKQVAERENEIEIYLRHFFDRLNKDSESPLCGYLSPSSSKRGLISRVTFNKGIQKVLGLNRLHSLSEEWQYTLIKNYFKAIENNISDFNLLFKAAYFEAFCDIFEDVLEKSFNKSQNYKLSSLDHTLEKIRNIDLSELLSGGKTKITKNTVIGQLKLLISDSSTISEDQV
jgi:DNA sulfur modification protein DndB